EVIRRFDGHADAALSPDGRKLLAASEESVRLWEVDTGRELRHWKVDTRIKRVGFVHLGKQAIAIDSRADVHFWARDTGASTRTLRGPPAWVVEGFRVHADVFADGRRAAVVYEHVGIGNDVFRLYDLERGEVIYTGEVFVDGGPIAGSPDGRRL